MKKIYKYKKGKKGVLKKMIDKEIKKLTPPVEIKQVTRQPAGFACDNNVGSGLAFIFGVIGADFALGSSPRQRVGDQIDVKKVSLSWTSTILNTHTDASYRLIMFVDNNYNGVTLPTDLTSGNIPLLNSTASAGFTINAPYNIDSVGRGKRFRILHDKIYKHHLPFTAASASTNCDSQTHRLHHVFKKPLRVLLPPTATAAEPTATEKQILVWWIQSNVATNNDIGINGVQLDTQYVDV